MSECPKPWWAKLWRRSRLKVHLVACRGENHDYVQPLCGTYLTMPCGAWVAVFDVDPSERCSVCSKMEEI